MKRLFALAAWLLVLSICLIQTGCVFDNIVAVGKDQQNTWNHSSSTHEEIASNSANDSESLFDDEGHGNDTASDQLTSLTTLESRYQIIELVEDDLEEIYGDTYLIDYISVQYYSQEYIEELTYNSLKNDYFGFNYDEVCQAMNGTNWSFTVIDGETVYIENPVQSEMLAQLVKDVAVGTGVILVCVVMSYATAGIGAAPVACFFAGAAKGAAITSIKSGAVGALIGGAVEGVHTKSFEGALDGALSGFGSGFKFGAIAGSITGGLTSSYCFTGDTIVTTSSGSISIQDIKIGDYVLSYDETNDVMEYVPVTDIFTNQVTELLVIQTEEETINTTYSHPFMTTHGWAKAGELLIGESLLTAHGETTITSIDKIQNECTVYNLSIAKNQTYTVGKECIIVHNACGDPAKLRNNMLDNGESEPLYPNAAHHIVPSSDSRFPEAEQSRKILEAFSIDINSAENGVFLSTDPTITGTTYHKTLHNAEYYKKVLSYLSQATTADEARDALSLIKYQLMNGTFVN